MKKIGKRLQELRESKGLSQSDLASYLGISQPLLSQIESGNRNLNLSLLDKLCSLYGCSDSYILCKSDEYNSINFSFIFYPLKRDYLTFFPISPVCRNPQREDRTAGIW